MSSPASGLAHVTSIVCAVDAARALRFLGDGLSLGRWALGSFATRRVGRGLYQGTSLFDGGTVLIRPVIDHDRSQVDYWVGTRRDALSPRIIARVAPTQRGTPGVPACVVSLVAWRSDAMGDAGWARLMACHEAEIHLIQSLLETARRPQRRAGPTRPAERLKPG